MLKVWLPAALAPVSPVALAPRRALAALDAEALPIERQFSGCRLWLSSVTHWWRRGRTQMRCGPPGRRVPLTLSADDLAGLRVQLVDAQAAADAQGWAGWPR